MAFPPLDIISIFHTLHQAIDSLKKKKKTCADILGVHLQVA